MILWFLLLCSVVPGLHNSKGTSVGDHVDGAIDGAKGKFGSVKDTISSSLGSATEKVGDAARGAKEKVGEKAGDAKEKVSGKVGDAAGGIKKMVGDIGSKLACLRDGALTKVQNLLGRLKGQDIKAAAEL